METTQSVKARFSGSALVAHLRPLVVGALVALVGCGPAEEGLESPHLTPRAQGMVSFEDVSSGLISTNGISLNGISLNGISLNGISLNGISLNGISLNGLSTEQFAQWFQDDPVQNEVFMRYMVRCGLPEQQSLSYTDPATGLTYTWTGLLGLTPKWAKDGPATEEELQLMTACLLAHTNKYGLHISISVLGNDSRGQKIKYTKDELATYSRREGCFFGNFVEGSVYVGSDWNHLDNSESTARACGLSSPDGVSSECPPLVHVGTCASVCELDNSGLFYERCTVNGKTYLPITTRLQPKDVYQCGDGVCQFTESCGSGTTWDSCQADCGACPSAN